MLNRILKDINKQRSFSQLNDDSIYLYSLGMSTKMRVLNYHSVTTIIDLIFFLSQLLDINVNEIHFQHR